MAYMFVIHVPITGKVGSSVHNELYGMQADISKSGKPMQDKPSGALNSSDSLEETLKDVLTTLNIKTDSWIRSSEETHWKVSFLVEREDTDHVLQQLCSIGIGDSPDSSVSIFLANYHRSSPENGGTEDDAKCGNTDERSEFIKSVKARLTVAQVVEAVKNKSTLTFDYCVFIFISSIIAVFGLAENNPVLIIVSILVSPLMGPILAALFGTVIRALGLFKLGVKNEGISLLLCLGIGFICGLIITGINHDGVRWNSDTAWPTPHMQDRGIPRGLWVGFFIAIPSGAGVALALLGGSTSPLVGVAVSASLLGPVVNAGMLFGCAIVYAAKPPPVLQSDTGNNYTPVVTSAEISPPDCDKLQNNNYEHYYTCNMGLEAFFLGLVSLAQTIIVIVCIFVTGIVVLKIKEVAPHTTKSETFDMFWKSDIKIARKEYKKKGSFIKTEDVARQIEEEEKEKRISVLPEVVLEIEEDNRYRQITDCLPERPPDLDVVLGSHTNHSSRNDLNHRSTRRMRPRTTSDTLSMSRTRHSSWLSVRRSDVVNSNEVILETDMSPYSRQPKFPKKQWIQNALANDSNNIPV